MKIVISDYENVLQKDLSAAVQTIQRILPESKIAIHAFQEKEDFYQCMADAEGLITAFLPVDAELFLHAPKLRCVSINAAGYNSVDLEAAKKSGIAVCHVGEYCTEEVAEHTIALLCALNRNLKNYGYQLEKEENWQYAALPGGKNLSSQTIAIFGFGKIGKRVAELARALGMEILVVSSHSDNDTAEKYHVKKVTEEEAFERADVISNHMSLTAENYHFFNKEAFSKMKRKPLFLNLGRGGSVDEAALVSALEEGILRGAGLDVLESESPDVKSCPLFHRENVIITPHSAFYSEESLRKLQIISAENVAYVLKGEHKKVQKNILF